MLLEARKRLQGWKIEVALASNKEWGEWVQREGTATAGARDARHQKKGTRLPESPRTADRLICALESEPDLQTDVARHLVELRQPVARGEG
jgi:hypothetical protein